MRLIFLYCLLIITSCKKEPEIAPIGSPAVPDKPVVPTKTFSYLALGDSYTVGQGVQKESSFPYLLSKSLSTDSIKWNATPLSVVAQTGWTTGDLIGAIESRNITTKFDIVTLLIGVNNQYRGYSQPAYRTEFIQLLNTALTFANGDKYKVFVLSIPDWGVTPYANGSDRAQIAKEIDEFNAINKEESNKLGVNYTDITAISRMAASDQSLIADDRLHPSGTMYQLWVNLLAPKVLAQLK